MNFTLKNFIALFTCIILYSSILAQANHPPTFQVNSKEWQEKLMLQVQQMQNGNITEQRRSSAAWQNNAYSAAKGLPGDGISCFDTSGRFFMKKDNVQLYPQASTVMSDGNLLISGEYYQYRVTDCGFVMKCTVKGELLWCKKIDSAAHKSNFFTNYVKVLELADHNILLAGFAYNSTTRNNDLVITKINGGSTIIWNKTYACRYWFPNSAGGSENYFVFTGLAEDSFTGDIYFSGSLWGAGRCITRVNGNNGTIIWSNSYMNYDGVSFDRAFGIDVSDLDKITCLGESLSGSVTNISAYQLNKINGDTIKTVHWRAEDNPGSNQIASIGSLGMVKMHDGGYLLANKQMGSSMYPYVTGNFHHASVIEINKQLEFVKAYSFTNSRLSNSYNTCVSVFPDNSGFFTMLQYFGSYSANVIYLHFRDGKIERQRVKRYNGEGAPLVNRSLQMPDGGTLSIAPLGDSVYKNYLKIEFQNFHLTDSSSACLGIDTNDTYLEPYMLKPSYNLLWKVERNVLSESIPQTYTMDDFTTDLLPGCRNTSFCDSLQLTTSATSLCTGDSLKLVVRKNDECYAGVLFRYDTDTYQSPVKMNDSIYMLPAKGPGNGYVYAITSGCKTLQDSVKVTVYKAVSRLDLGKDTVLCPGNTITLHAGPDWASYKWQDGDADSIYTVKKAGTYSIETVNGCGTLYHDTVVVKDHPPIPFDIGPDRKLCSGDTLILTAPAGFIQYQWSPGYRINSTVGIQTKIYPQKDTVYHIRAEKTAGCFVYDSVQITVNNAPALELGADTSLCMGDSLLLSAGNAYVNYLWSSGETRSWIKVAAKGEYSLKATADNGCFASDTISVLNLYSLPIVSLGNDTVLCKGSSRTLSAGQHSGYQWNTGATGASITVNTTGNYAVRVTNAYGCKADAAIHINKLVTPPANFLPADTAICQYGSLVLSAPVTYRKFLWNTSATTASVDINKPGLYWVQLEDVDGCYGRDSIIVRPKQCMEGFYIPTAFTPNGDSKNDYFRPLIFGTLEAYEFTIYNRWGQRVFFSKSPGQGWDGNFNKVYQDNFNAFVWICKFRLRGKPEEFRKGTVLIIR